MTGLITEARELCELRRKQKHIPMTMLDKTLELCDALEKAEAQIKSIHQSLDFAETQRQKCKNYPELAINNGLALGRIAVALKHDFKQPLPAPPEEGADK